jgi:hypothetical protein
LFFARNFCEQREMGVAVSFLARWACRLAPPNATSPGQRPKAPSPKRDSPKRVSAIVEPPERRARSALAQQRSSLSVLILGRPGRSLITWDQGPQKTKTSHKEKPAAPGPM